MSDWIAVCPAEEFKAGERRVVDVDDVEVIVVNLAGEFFAVEDICTHDYASMCDGVIDGDEIICPRHEARFNLKSGEAMCPPAYEPVATFPVQVENGIVQVRDARWD